MSTETFVKTTYITKEMLPNLDALFNASVISTSKHCTIPYRMATNTDLRSIKSNLDDKLKLESKEL